MSEIAAAAEALDQASGHLYEAVRYLNKLGLHVEGDTVREWRCGIAGLLQILDGVDALSKADGRRTLGIEGPVPCGCAPCTHADVRDCERDSCSGGHAPNCAKHDPCLCWIPRCSRCPQEDGL